MLLFVLVLFSFTRASVVFEDCGSAFELESVNIEGCGRRLPCYVTLGQEVPVSIEFLADNRPFRLDQDVVINVNHINLKAPVKPDPCDNSQCPVSTDRITSLMSIMYVPRDIAQNQRGWLRWKVFSDTGRQVVCFSVMVETQTSLQRIIRNKIQQLLPNNSVTQDHPFYRRPKFVPLKLGTSFMKNEDLESDNAMF